MAKSRVMSMFTRRDASILRIKTSMWFGPFKNFCVKEMFTPSCTLYCRTHRETDKNYMVYVVINNTVTLLKVSIFLWNSIMSFVVTATCETGENGSIEKGLRINRINWEMNFYFIIFIRWTFYYFRSVVFICDRFYLWRRRSKSNIFFARAALKLLAIEDRRFNDD